MAHLGNTIVNGNLKVLNGLNANSITQNGTAVSLSTHTHNYAGSSSAGGAATSAAKLNTNAGSGTQPVYFSNGVPVATTYALNATVPSGAKFTDTTYSAATQSAAGLMSADDKKKLDGIAVGANNYTYTLPSATSSVLGGVKIGSNITVSSGTISLTKANVTTALGYTPPTTDTKYTHPSAGANTGSFGPSANASPAHGGTFSVPYVTVNADGHVTAASTKTITLPAAPTSVTSATKLATARAIDGVNFNGSAAITHYGTCSTAAATAAKMVACASYTLVTGSRIIVKFTVTNTAASPTLNVNSTGAKAIQYRGAAITAGYLAANRTYEFVYDGTNYQLIGDIDTNTNTTYSAGTGISLSGTTFSNSGVRSVTAGSNGIISVNTNGTAANVTVYTHPTGAGNNHIPSGGSANQVLVYSAAGTAAWGAVPSHTHSYTNDSALSESEIIAAWNAGIS